MASRARLGERAAVASAVRRDPGAPRSRIAAFAAAHQHWVAAGAFALVALIYLWPALVQGQPLLASSILYVQSPWEGVVPSDIGRYYNLILNDQPLSYYPWDVLSRSYVRSGVFPAWNPHALGGTPFFGNPEVAWLSPFTWPLWILPLNYALGVVAAAKLWLGGFGTYLLVRELRLGTWPGIVAGLSYMLCSFNLLWLGYAVHTQVAIMLPWAVWLVERTLRRNSLGAGLGLVAVIGLVMTGGHPGTQLHVLTGVVGYALIRALLLRERDRGRRVQALAIVGVAVALGTLLAAATLLPAQRAAVDTAGALARRNGGDELSGARLSLAAVRAVLFPDWWGRPSEATWQAGSSTYNERAFFGGVIPLVLAVAALLTREQWRRKLPFVLLGALGLAVGLRAPVIRDAVVHAPVFDMVQNQRLQLLFQFAVAVLSAFGLQAVLDGRPGRRRAWVALVAALAAAALAIVTLTTGAGALRRAIHYMLHRSGEVVAGVLPLASIGWMLVFAAALAVLLLLARRPGLRRVVGAATVVVVALEMLHFAHGFQPMGPASRAIPPRMPSIAFLQQHRDEGRMAALGYALAPDWTTVLGLDDARGYDAPQPSLRFHRLWKTMSPRQTTHNSYAFWSLGPETVRVLSLLGTRYVLLEPGTVPSGAEWRIVYRGEDATIVANDDALPHALVARRARVAADEAEELRLVTEAGFDPQREVVVRRDELPASFDVAQRGGGDVRVVDRRNSRVTLHASLRRPAVVLLDDAWAPGWSVRVDGRPAQALQTDVVLRGVAVPAGEHEIVWSYRVPGLRAGAGLSLLALLATLAWAGVLVVRRRRSG